VRMEQWLTSTVPGIIILGAAGSILALGILWAFRLIPLPLKWHHKRKTKQAFMLGYSAATIENDETGRNLIALLFHHLSLLLICLTALLFCSGSFLAILVSQSDIALTWVLFILSSASFTIVYFIYFEFDFIYRTYLFYWKGPLKRARESYVEREAGQINKSSQPE